MSGRQHGLSIRSAFYFSTNMGVKTEIWKDQWWGKIWTFINERTGTHRTYSSCDVMNLSRCYGVGFGQRVEASVTFYITQNAWWDCLKFGSSRAILLKMVKEPHAVIHWSSSADWFSFVFFFVLIPETVAYLSCKIQFCTPISGTQWHIWSL